jgi:hypothetical protein
MCKLLDVDTDCNQFELLNLSGDKGLIGLDRDVTTRLNRQGTNPFLVCNGDQWPSLYSSVQLAYLFSK